MSRTSSQRLESFSFKNLWGLESFFSVLARLGNRAYRVVAGKSVKNVHGYKVNI